MRVLGAVKWLAWGIGMIFLGLFALMVALAYIGASKAGGPRITYRGPREGDFDTPHDEWVRSQEARQDPGGGQ